MDYKPRPYKGRAAELAELDALTTSTANSLPQKDTAIEAGKKCLLIGGLTAPLFIGFPFLSAAFVLGIYAMATDRLKQGLKISLLATALAAILPVITYLVFGVIFLNILSTAFQGITTMPRSTEVIPLKKLAPPIPIDSANPSPAKAQIQPTVKWPPIDQRSTPQKPNSPKPAIAKNDQIWEPQTTSTQKPSKVANENRRDHVIPRNELTHIPGFGPVSINHDHAYIYFSTFKGQKPRKIRKTKGLHPTDTNRTLITKSGSTALYFVDTIAGATNVQIAVITE